MSTPSRSRPLEIRPDTELFRAPVVAMLMPHYGPVEFGACQAFLMAPLHNRFVQVCLQAARTTSLLPYTFNMLLCDALDARDHGVRDPDGELVHATHMAMLHADIQPYALNWLDLLYAEMHKSGADLVSAVVPIKSPDGDTSTAVGKVSDPWHHRRLSAVEADALPTTFGTTDVNGGDPDAFLMANTGCFLADLRRPYWHDFAFGFQTRVFKDEAGHWKTQIRPEDWEMSRHLHLAGAKVCVTSRVPLMHLGGGEWPNHATLRLFASRASQAANENPESTPVVASLEAVA
ncbi:MAG: hypothetical protein AB7G11_02680 [Phycisphaerales bacterium]